MLHFRWFRRGGAHFLKKNKEKKENKNSNLFKFAIKGLFLEGRLVMRPIINMNSYHSTSGDSIQKGNIQNFVSGSPKNWALFFCYNGDLSIWIDPRCLLVSWILVIYFVKIVIIQCGHVLHNLAAVVLFQTKHIFFFQRWCLICVKSCISQKYEVSCIMNYSSLWIRAISPDRR